MNATEQNEKPFDPLTDTGKAIVAAAVSRIKAELEMHRALTRDDLRQVLRDHERERLRFWRGHIEKAWKYLFGIVEIDDKR